MARKLGKLAPKYDHRTLQFEKYTVKALLPPPPTSVGFYSKVTNWPMMMNDTIGDCTCAGAGHMIQAWTTNVGNPFIPTDAQVLSAYEAVGGYKPSDPSTDRGANMLDVLNYWRAIGIGGHKIQAFLQFPTATPKACGWHFKNAIWAFGGAYLGIQLPLTAQNQVGTEWVVPRGGAKGDGAAGSWGGHCVPALEYDATGITVITWGALQRMSWSFFTTYCDEAYAVLSPDWVTTGKLSPSQFAYDLLVSDIASL